MDDAERYRLIGGPYLPPRDVKYGKWLTCEVRGRVRSGGYAETGPIGPWPCILKTGRAALIVTPELARAVRTESSQAIQHWWGVSGGVVWSWRKALGIRQTNEGTARLYREYAPEKLIEEVVSRGRANAIEPDAIERNRKAHLGRPMHPKTKAALLEASQRPKSVAWTAQMIQRLNKRPSRPPRKNEWQPEEDALLGTDFDREVAAKLRRTIAAVRMRRKALKIPAFVSFK